jgi:hypothetical protein
MNNSPIQFNTLIRDHPQLTEKSLIDFINGLEVIDDHIRVRETVNKQFISRVWGDLNGENVLRQQTIDQHVTESLKTVSTWLQCLQQQQIQSDLAIAKIGHKLLETRQGIMVLLEKHNNLQYQVNEILISMDSITECVQTVIETAMGILGIIDTQPSEFLHVQSFPAEKQRDVILASAAIPL